MQAEQTTQPAIELTGLEKTFGRQKVLRQVNLNIAAGKTTVIVGGSGQGKSVILKHMLGLVRPDCGSVKVFGQELLKISKKELNHIRMEFGVLFQNSALFDSMTVFDNVALPLRERTKMPEAQIRAKVREKLDMMDLKDSDHKYPAQLSGGMKKRVGLARALVLNPKVVFFDEPTTGLEPRNSSITRR
ncbi:MAG: ATP-binding cassette domain-containing protein [Desulfuromonadaceae bacterium]